MPHPEQQYLQLLRDLTSVYLPPRNDRTGVGTRSLFARQMRFDLSEGFPLLTTKKLHLKSIIVELLWMLRGDTNVKWLREYGVTIWDEWADENGDLGPVYGAQWRSWPKYIGLANGDAVEAMRIDQISELIDGLRTKPYSRRHVVSAWNVGELDGMALPPCHCLFQMFVRDTDDGPMLDCHLYQRSADVFLGVPYNIASYAALTMIVAAAVGMEPGEFVWTGGDVHLYDNHRAQARLQAAREPRPFPRLEFTGRSDIFSYSPAHFMVTGYDPHPHIKAAVAI